MDLLSEQELSALTTSELEKVWESLPRGTAKRLGLLIETLRVLDYWTLFQELLPAEKRLSAWDFELMRWGWGLLAPKLLAPLDVFGAMPMRASTIESRHDAMQLLHLIGRAVLLRRTGEMIKFGVVHTELNDGEWQIRRADENAGSLLSDQNEFAEFRKLEDRLKAQNTSETAEGWTLVERDRIGDFEDVLGSFISKKDRQPWEDLLQDDIWSLLRPFVEFRRNLIHLAQ